MRKAILLSVLALALPVTLLADSATDYAIFGQEPTTASSSGSIVVGGTISVTALLTAINGASVPNGAVSFTTGALTATAIVDTFTFTGGLLDITSSTNQTLFQGKLSGTLIVDNGVLFISALMGNGDFGKSASITLQEHGGIVSGDAIVSNIVTPEPGTLGLLGTGLAGIAGLARRKCKAA